MPVVYIPPPKKPPSEHRCSLPKITSNIRVVNALFRCNECKKYYRIQFSSWNWSWNRCSTLRAQWIMRKQKDDLSIEDYQVSLPY